MNGKQRILTALNNEQPDRVPTFELQIDEPIIIAIAAILSYESKESRTATTVVYGEEGTEVLDQYCFLVKELELDSTCRPLSLGITRMADNLGRDKFGCVYHLSAHGDPMVVEGPIQDASDVTGYDMASRLEADDFAKLSYINKKTGVDRAHFMGLNDPFKISWQLRGGMDTYLADYAWHPSVVHALSRVTTDFCIAAIEMAPKFKVDAIVLEGDLSGETSTLISPRHYREYIKPYHREIVNCAHRNGLKVVKHSDGNAWPILDDFVEVGFDGFHPVQPQCMDIGKVKAHVAGRLCLVGNIDCRHLLPFGTVEQVEQTVKQTIETAAPGGGYIISSSNSIHPGCQPENYLAMVKAAHKYGRLESIQL